MLVAGKYHRQVGPAQPDYSSEMWGSTVAKSLGALADVSMKYYTDAMNKKRAQEYSSAMTAWTEKYLAWEREQNEKAFQINPETGKYYYYEQADSFQKMSDEFKNEIDKTFTLQESKTAFEEKYNMDVILKNDKISRDSFKKHSQATRTGLAVDLENYIELRQWDKVWDQVQLLKQTGLYTPEEIEKIEQAAMDSQNYLTIRDQLYDLYVEQDQWQEAIDFVQTANIPLNDKQRATLVRELKTDWKEVQYSEDLEQQEINESYDERMQKMLRGKGLSPRQAQQIGLEVGADQQHREHWIRQANNFLEGLRRQTSGQGVNRSMQDQAEAKLLDIYVTEPNADQRDIENLVNGWVKNGIMTPSKGKTWINYFRTHGKDQVIQGSISTIKEEGKNAGLNDAQIALVQKHYLEAVEKHAVLKGNDPTKYQTLTDEEKIKIMENIMDYHINPKKRKHIKTSIEGTINWGKSDAWGKQPAEKLQWDAQNGLFMGTKNLYNDLFHQLRNSQQSNLEELLNKKLTPQQTVFGYWQFLDQSTGNVFRFWTFNRGGDEHLQVWDSNLNNWRTIDEPEEAYEEFGTGPTQEEKRIMKESKTQKEYELEKKRREGPADVIPIYQPQQTPRPQ